MATGNSSENPIIQTNSGKVRGTKTETLYGYKYYYFDGIPYARAPLGSLRFKAPEPVNKWPGIKDCTQSPKKCIQWNRHVGEIQGSEDCLYLNINVKEFNTRQLLPVMVYIHGGGFNSGDPTRRAWSPDYLMMKDVVVVSIGYRVGFVGHASFSDRSLGIPGNSGFKDVVQALKWIRSNIQYFNGDSNNITLFGHSSGSCTVHSLMQTNTTKGLFHKAILLAGFQMDKPILPRLEYRLAKHLGYKGNESDEKSICKFLQEVEASKLVNFDLYTKDEILFYGEQCKIFPCFPTMETYVDSDTIFQQDPVDAHETTWSNFIPVMMGTCSTESLVYTKIYQNNAQLLDLFRKSSQHLMQSQIKFQVKDEQLLTEMANKLKTIHFGDKEVKVENVECLIENKSYDIYHSQHRLMQSRLKHAVAPTYVYRFDFDSPTCNYYRNRLAGPNIRGVGHCDELGYIFHLPYSLKLDTNSTEYKCIELMVDTFYAFAKNSDPNNRQIQPAHWEPIKPHSVPECLNINYEWTKVIPMPEYDKCCARDEMFKMANLKLY